MLYGQLADLRLRAARYAAPVAALTMHTSKTVRGVKPSAVAGLLRFADGSSPAGLAVDVELQTAGSAWTRVTGAQVGADGRWSAGVTLQHSASLRAVFAGDGARPRMESGPIAVRAAAANS